MRTWMAAVATMGVMACTDGGSIGPGGGNGQVSGLTLPARDPDEVLTGDLSTGASQDLGFADNVEYTCFPSTENVNFDGNHVFFTVAGAEMLTIAVNPDAGVDTSVYAMGFSGDVPATPDATEPSTNCEAGYDQDGDSNAGKPDALELFLSNTTWQVMVGVAGANGATSGAFEVQIWRDDTTLE